MQNIRVGNPENLHCKKKFQSESKQISRLTTTIFCTSKQNIGVAKICIATKISELLEFAQQAKSWSWQPREFAKQAKS